MMGQHPGPEPALDCLYIDDPQGLSLLTKALNDASRVGLDTEADSLHHYFEKVCLIQLSFIGRHYIVDPLAGFPLDGFLNELAQKELILQGADYDLRMLKKSFGFRPRAAVFDTMLAAQVLGEEKIGLGALVEKYCGVVLAHTGQKSDWSRRPLSLGQLRYATDDTKYLEAIADAQGERLKECGRLEWHRECCERAVEAAGAPPKDEGKEAWRIKGSSKMSPRALALLREIWAWRDEIARQRDRPPFMIMKNEDLLGWVAWREKNPEGPVCQGPRMPQRIKEGDLVRLEDAVRRAEALSPVEWPGPLPKVRSFGAGPSQEKVEALFNACKAIAADLKMDPYFLASRATVTALVRTRPRSIAEAQEKAGMMRWQAALVMPALTKTL